MLIVLVQLQHKSVIEIEKQLIRDFLCLCDSFVDNRSSTHFGENKTKSGNKHKLRNAKSLKIVYNGRKIKEHAKV